MSDYGYLRIIIVRNGKSFIYLASDPGELSAYYACKGMQFL